MDRIKRAAFALLIFVMLLSIVSCGEGSGSSSANKPKPPEMPGNFSAPEKPGNPGIPGFPENPDIPGFPGLPGEEIPGMPGEEINSVNGSEVIPGISGVAINLSKYDLDNSDSPNGAVKINLSNGSTVIEGEGASFSNGVVSIEKAGNYYLAGSLEGQIRISAGKDDKVKLILAGVDLINGQDACIYAESGDKVMITLASGTENTVRDTDSSEKKEGDSRAPAAIYGCCSLTVNGSGKLNVSSTYNNAIGTKKTLKIVEGTITVSAENAGLKGNNAVIVAGGRLTANVKGDGIKTEETEDTEKGYVYIGGGNLNIQTQSDGINGSLHVYIAGGTIDIVTTGTTVSSSSGGNTGGYYPPYTRPGGGGWGGGSVAAPDSKGIKAGSTVEISDGTVTVNSTGHAVHSKQNVFISGGCLTAASSKGKGIQAHGDLHISGGKVCITKSTEGLESKGNMYITGGETEIYATDDGINIGSSNKALYIEGGKLLVKVGSGDTDGIDSNGAIYITGGETVVLYGSASGSAMASAFDCDGTISVKGGTVIAFGGSGIYPNKAASTNLFREIKTSLAVGNYELRDESGTVLWKGEVRGAASYYSEMWISSDRTEEGKKYTLYKDGTAVTTFTQDNATGGTSSGMGGRPGRF